MHKKACLLFLWMVIATGSHAQTTYLPLGSDDYLLLDRLETLSGRLCDSLRLNDKAESRKNAVNFLEMISAKMVDKFDSAQHTGIDRYNMKQMISENGEWAPDEHGFIKSRRHWAGNFYKYQHDFIHVKTKDFFLVINPVINIMSTAEHNSPAIKGTSNNLTYNSHDLEMRGWLGKKIGFYTSFTDNQEQVPGYVYNYTIKDSNRIGLPGSDYVLLPKNRSSYFDYLNASGYIDFAALKDRVNITFGSGKHFVGDGINSLFLSDFSANTPFLRLRTRIWKVNYETLYLELTEQFKREKDTNYPHKFATMHSISYNVNRWFNFGFFEAVVFDRRNVYEMSYLNPIVFTLSLNSYNGGGDKSLLGFYGKMLVKKHVQLYGQVMLNEFKSSEFFSNKGWYGNKWGIQAGAKYFDALGIKNLDLQCEMEAVRPYTYTAQDTLANYTNYNQPLADPLGAGFVKTIGIIRYQPIRNVTLTVKGMYYVQGVDTGHTNSGNNIFNSYLSAPKGSATYGVKLINGARSQCSSINVNLSYQVRRNMFIDAGAVYRKYENASGIYPDFSTTGTASGPLTTSLMYLGIRINAARRDYSFY